MATLEKIRKRAGILIMAFIGLAMLGFILGDFNVRPSTKVAEINGKSYNYSDYQNVQTELVNFYKQNYGQNLDPQLEQQIEDEVWRRIVRNSVMEKPYQKLGIEVSTEELKAMVQGNVGTGNQAGFNEPHPIVRQMFSNPETGEFNQYFMMNYFSQLGSEQFAQERERWYFIENEIVDERKNQKYMTLISKGLSPSSLDIQDYYLENEKKVDFSYISRSFTEVSDEEISYTDADLKAYYNEHKESYKRKESRSIEYVLFEVVASEDDDTDAKLWTAQTKNEFGRTEKASMISYINSVSDVPFDERFYTKDELNPLIQDSVLALPEGEVFGPYYEDNSYKLSKVQTIEARPDSVRARHILIGYNVVGSAQAAEYLADSLKTAIEENGGDFNQIALEYSADESNRSIGGDLGWFKEGMMETPFNNACFENNTGDLVLATTRYGVHIIRIEAQSRPVEKYQVATIVHTVYPSNATDQDYYNRAVKFRGKATNIEKFEEQAKEYGLDPRIVPGIAKDQRTIAGLGNPVNIIGWAFNADEGDVSNIFEIEDQYIVCALTEVQDEGYADFESVKNEIELAVKKKKKGEYLVAQIEKEMATASDMSSLATALNAQVQDASQVQYANTYVTGIGMEPYIVGSAMYLPQDAIAGPFIGENSVFVLSVNNRLEADPEGDKSAIENRLKYSVQSRTNYEAYNAMIEEANIEDNRLRVFYGR